MTFIFFCDLLSLCHSEFSSESFSLLSSFQQILKQVQDDIFLDRMTVRWGSCGLTTQTSASSFKNFFPSWLALLFFMGGESATKTFPINGRGEWKSLNASPIGGSGFSVRPNIRTFYPKLFYVSSRPFQQILKQVQDDILFSFFCHSEFISESFFFTSRPSYGSWNKFRMTNGGSNFFLRGSHFFFMGGKAPRKLSPSMVGENENLWNASPIGGSGFSVRPNIRTFYPKLFTFPPVSKPCV